MTADARIQTSSHTWRAVVIFLALTALLSAVFLAFINLTQTVTVLYVFALMMPGLAAVLTSRIVGPPLNSLGLGRWNGRFVLIAYATPVAYSLVASRDTWLLGYGALRNDEFVATVASTLRTPGAPHWAVIAVFVVLQARRYGRGGSASPERARKRGGAGSLCRAGKGVAVPPGCVGVASDLGIVAVPDYVGGLPRRGRSSVVLAADVHVRRRGDQLRAGLGCG
jgi:hypothetical protein